LKDDSAELALRRERDEVKYRHALESPAKPRDWMSCSQPRAGPDFGDDGPGFTPESLAYATERFWRGDASRPRGGTGRMRLANAAAGDAVK